MKKYLGKIVLGVAALFAVVAILMILAPAAVAKVGGAKQSGVDVTFGYKQELMPGVKVSILKFSFGNFVPYILLVVGIVFVVLACLKKLGIVAPIVAAVAFVVAGIFFFLPAYLVVPGKEMLAAMGGASASDFRESLLKSQNLGAGYIVAAVFSFISAIASVGYIFISKKIA